MQLKNFTKISTDYIEYLTSERMIYEYLQVDAVDTSPMISCNTSRQQHTYGRNEQVDERGY